MDRYDVVVVGGGPGGYVAAIRAAQLGFTTACIDAWVDAAGKPALGGVCLNVGCIPSKALLDSSHLYETIARHTKDHGIAVSGLSLDLPSMMLRKDKVVRTLTQGIAGLFKKNNVAWHAGQARLLGDMRVSVTERTPAEASVITASHIIIATGSVPAALPGIEIDNELICDSTAALAFSEVPRRLGIIGAGAIGLELGSVWRRLGSEVVILEALSEFLPGTDFEIAQATAKELARQDLAIRLGCTVTGVTVNGTDLRVEYQKDQGQHDLAVDRLIVAVGRRPNTDELGLLECGINLDGRGFVEVDDQCRTNLRDVFAIGDVIGGPMLAHKASEEGMAVAETIAGHATEVNYACVPSIIYTWPEVAWVGQTEQSLKTNGTPFRRGVFPFLASGRARAMGETAGLVKILGDAESDALLGVHIFGPNASELISEAVIAMEFGASTEDLARAIHAHPTLAEAMHVAALAVDKRTINL
ncbi:MAG: dihydrolipoyl dehydrogenase [Pseudomonadota bacterium]|nr:dihydrolipoyl dehydrogenase [Pseudomonadota bacterium]